MKGNQLAHVVGLGLLVVAFSACAPGPESEQRTIGAPQLTVADASIVVKGMG